MEELAKLIASCGLRFEQLLILFLLGYIFKVQFEQQKQRIWATLEREQRVLMMEEIQRRVRRAEAMVEALCERLQVVVEVEDDDGRRMRRASMDRPDVDDAGGRTPSPAPQGRALALLRELTGAGRGCLDELAEVREQNHSR